MERIIKQNKDEITLKYIVVVLLSWLTLRKIDRMENLKKELKQLKEQLEQDDYFGKL